MQVRPTTTQSAMRSAPSHNLVERQHRLIPVVGDRPTSRQLARLLKGDLEAPFDPSFARQPQLECLYEAFGTRAVREGAKWAKGPTIACLQAGVRETSRLRRHSSAVMPTD